MFEVQPKTKLVASLLIEVPAEIIRQAADLLTASGKTHVVLSTVNGYCFGIETGAPVLKLAGPKAIDVESDLHRPAPRKAKLTLKTITPEIVLDVLREHGTMMTVEISDSLDLPRNNRSVRDKVSRMIGVLKSQKRIVERKDAKGRHYTATKGAGSAPKRMPIKTTKADNVKMRKTVTEDSVFMIIREHQPVMSKVISDKLGIPVGNLSVRGRVSNVLLKLRKSKRIRIVSGNKSMASYGLTEATQATG